MALVSPKMSLRVWDQLSDPYNHDQLADNWSKVDLHDHTPGRGVQIPTEGIADGAITSTKLAASNIISSAQVVDGSLVDTDLASPNNVAYKTVAIADGIVNAGATAGNYVFGTGGTIQASGVATAVTPATFPFNTTDYTVANKTTVFRLITAWVCNATAPTSTFTPGMFAFTVAGGAGNIAPTLTSVVTGSNTGSVVAPSASSFGRFNTSADFSMGASGNYVFGMAISVATVAASSMLGFRILLQVRNT